MNDDQIVGILGDLSKIATLLPAPVGGLAVAALAIASEAVQVSRDPAAELEKLRLLLRAGITATLQERLNRP